MSRAPLLYSAPALMDFILVELGFKILHVDLERKKLFFDAHYFKLVLNINLNYSCFDKEIDD